MSTKLSLEDPNPGVWFKFDESDPKSGEIALRPANNAKREEIIKKTVKRRVEYKHGQRFEVNESNDNKFSEMLWDYCIVDWKDLVDDSKKEIPCTTENKVFFMKNHVGFASFVGEKLATLNDQYEINLTLEKENL